jgi:CO dehydrogenase maturation factor
MISWRSDWTSASTNNSSVSQSAFSASVLIQSKRILVAGKGGSGKSTIVAAIAKLAVGRVSQVLVVDADESNPGIERMLGLGEPIPSLIDVVGGRKQVFGIIKDESSEAVQTTVRRFMQKAKNNDLFLVRVGKINEAGSGCACPHGAISREVLSYPFADGTLVLVDAEAGIEHFGRGLDARVEIILFIVDPSYDTMKLCQEAKRLADSIPVRFFVVLNKVPSEDVSDFLRAELSKKDVNAEFVIPYDDNLFRSTLLGRPLEMGVARKPLDELVNAILSQSSPEEPHHAPGQEDRAQGLRRSPLETHDTLMSKETDADG